MVFMVRLDFELPSDLATRLQNQAENTPNRVDEIVEFALLKLFDTEPSIEMDSLPDLDLAPSLLALFRVRVFPATMCRPDCKNLPALTRA